MKKLMKHLRSACLASCIILGTVLAAAPGSAQAASWTNRPAQNGKVYSVIRHFLNHVVNRDPYSFYSTIPCTGELRECIGYLLDAWQTQGVDLISYFNLHWSASYPYANVRNFCAQLDKMLTPGSTVKIPCGSSSFTFLYKKYKNADAAFADGAFNSAGTIGLLTSPTEQYGHCWISLGAFDPYISEYEMRVFLESYYGLGTNALAGKLATGDANMVWKGYGSRSVWRVHATRWSEGVHGGCAVDNGASGEALKDALCYVLIPVGDIGAPSPQPSQPTQPTQPVQPTQPAQAMGDLSVQLVSSLPDVTDGNPNYSLGGLKIGVYADAACTKELVSVPADAKGHATIRCYAPQTVYVRLKSSAPGYESAETRSAVITQDKTTELSLSLTPKLMSVNISVQAQPSSSLDGAVFIVRHYACTDPGAVSESKLTAAWTVTADESGAVFGEETTAVVQAPKGTDSWYTDADGRIVFPLGILAVEQIWAAKGDSLDGVWAAAGCSAGGSVPVPAASSREGSNAPVIYFTSACGSLQSLVSDGTTAFLVTVSPAGAASDQTRCIVPSEKRSSGLWYVTGSSGSEDPLALTPVLSCRLFSAGGNAKPDGAPMQAGDVLRLSDRNGEVCFEGTVSLSGDGTLRMSDLICFRSRIPGDRLRNGLSPDAAGSDPADIRSRLFGASPITQAAP